MKRKKLGSQEFELWYSIYPVKKGVMVAMKSWNRDKLDSDATEIIEHTQSMMANDESWLEGYAPHPATYLNQQRYYDEVTERLSLEDQKTADRNKAMDINRFQSIQWIISSGQAMGNIQTYPNCFRREGVDYSH